MRECNCLETHIPRNGHTLWPSECDDYSAVRQQKKKKITHFVKFVTTVFPLRIAEGMLSVTPHGPDQSRTHRGVEQTVTTNSSVRQFFRGSVEDCQFESSERHSCRCHAL